MQLSPTANRSQVLSARQLQVAFYALAILLTIAVAALVQAVGLSFSVLQPATALAVAVAGALVLNSDRTATRHPRG